jgi:nitric oxide dioxygenase
MTPEQIEVIRQTVPVVQQHGCDITTVFYRNMLTAHPELNSVFNSTSQKTGHQARALAGALSAYAANIDNLAALGPTLELICNKHASLNITPEQYGIVGEYLIDAMQEVLAAAFTPAIQDAWVAAYWQLANVMIEKEALLYEQDRSWAGWRDFTVSDIIPESDEISSFILRPADRAPLPAFLPGQYVSVRVHVPRLGYTQARQYSLSDRPNPDYYRISIKRETDQAPGESEQDGLVSNVLHLFDSPGKTIQMSYPRGDFFFTSPQGSCPVVLIAAGVGITPLLSMFNSILDSTRKVARGVHLIHAVRTTGARAFHDHLVTAARKNVNFKLTFYVEQPRPEEQAGTDFTHVGRVNIHGLNPRDDLYLHDRRAEYYICGPAPFMQSLRASLLGFGVEPCRIKMELFGSGGPELVASHASL